MNLYTEADLQRAFEAGRKMAEIRSGTQRQMHIQNELDVEIEEMEDFHVYPDFSSWHWNYIPEKQMEVA